MRMRGLRGRRAITAMALLLGACSSAPDPQPGTVTTDQTQQLNDAAEMLDANSIALAPAATANDRTQP
jgi:PBP1b-binding outer membrane lipoprotein LpoB